MAGQIRVDFGSMDNAATQARSRATEIEDTLRTAGANVASLRGEWTGTGSDSFDALFTRWQQGVTQAIEALHQIAQGINVANTGYQDADSGAASTFRG